MPAARTARVCAVVAVTVAGGVGLIRPALASTGPVSPNDPYFSGGMNGQEWGETLDQATTAWSMTTGSSAVTVAVVDSGVGASQADLASLLVPGWNVLTGTSNTADSYGHGTEVAGVAAAATNNGQGIAAYCWSCRLMPVEVYNSGSGASAANVASGINWAVNHGANVINVSLTGPADSSALDSAVAYALSHNVAVVAAAGDGGATTKMYPAAIPGVISVAASTQTDSLQTYSQYGSWVDVAAPGSQATTLPNGAYGSVGGTSVAAPAVTGILGLMLSVDPGATPSQLASALYGSTDPVSGADQVAYGRVNAYRALQAIQQASSGSTTTTSSTTSTTTTSTTTTSTTTTSTTAPLPPTQTQTFTGSVGAHTSSLSYTVTAGAGTAKASLSFAKCASLSLSLLSGSQTLAATTGPSVLSLQSGISGGSYTFRVAGSCKTSFSLTVTTPSA